MLCTICSCFLDKCIFSRNVNLWLWDHKSSLYYMSHEFLSSTLSYDSFEVFRSIICLGLYSGDFIICGVVGAFAIFLLSWFKFGQKLDLHPKGIIAVIIAIFSISFWNSYYKYMIEGVQVHDYTALQFSITGACLFLYMLVRWKLTNLTKAEVTKVLPYASVTLILFTTFFLYLIPNMYLLWPLSLSYKMLSYSLVVPILLSVIFLWEPVNRTRIMAFGLTIVSIFLFLI